MPRSFKSVLLFSVAASLSLAACSGARTHGRAVSQPVNLQDPGQLALENDTYGRHADIRDLGDIERIARLESEVEQLKRETFANRPKIAKIDVIEQKFKDLSLGLDRIDAAYGTGNPAPQPVRTAAIETAKPVQAKPAAVVKKAEAPAPKPAPKTAGKEVLSVRVGEQKNGSRIVLDLGQPVKITYDIDNSEKILLIDIPGFTWSADQSETLSKSPLIASYQAQSDASGSRLAVQLKKPARVSNYSQIGATGGKYPRAVLDIQAE